MLVREREERHETWLPRGTALDLGSLRAERAEECFKEASVFASLQRAKP